MAENKKSFILYTDLIHTVSHLNDEQAGRLFKHILSYVNDENPISDDVITNLSFEPVKQALKRDLKKYESYIDKQKANGKKGGRPKKIETQKTQAFLEKPKKADSVSVSVNDSVNVNVNKIEEECILQPLNIFIDEVKQGYHAQAIELWYMELKLKKGSLTRLLTETFKGQLLTDEKVHENTQDLKKHFKSWLNVMDRNGKLNEYKITKKGGI